ncbi:hypothetical protein AcV5_006804 [Taiwanofungus camphoratus]|nr:hypothetical protein AcV5_006804 [Antrodia cinnamomea]
MLVVQVYFYHLWFPHDAIALKCFVYGILAYETVQTGLVTAVAFDVYVYGYGNMTALVNFHNTWFSVTIMCSVISAAVQCFFAWRIWVVARSRVLLAVILFLSVGQMCVGIVGGSKLRVVDPSAASSSSVTPIISTWLAGAALVDVIIAIAMTIQLLKAKTGIPYTDALVNRIIRLVVETGTLTATIAVLDVIFFTVLNKTLLHECPALILAKLYANTLVTNLNNRVIMNRVTYRTDATSTLGGLSSQGVSSNITQGLSAGITAANLVEVNVLRESFPAANIALQERNLGKGRLFRTSTEVSGKDTQCKAQGV